MAITLSASGEQRTLELTTNKRGESANLVLRLFKNDHVPSRDDTRESYVEADFPGYSAKELEGPRWTISENREKQTREATFPAQIFLPRASNEPQLVYGYFYTYVGGALHSAERFAGGPFSVQNSGDRVTVNPKLDAGSRSG